MLSSRKRAAFAFITVVASTAGAVALAELVLRSLGIGYGNAPLETHPVLNHVHPQSYTFLAHTPSNEYGGFHVYYSHDRRTISRDEWRTRSLQPERACRVAFLGDSFTEAGQVAFEESFVGLIAQYSSCEVRNYAVSSYSPIFYLTQWIHEVKAFRPTMVVVQLYSNDIGGDADFAQTAQFNLDGLPTAIPGPPDDIITRTLRSSYVARLVRKAQLIIQWRLGQRSEPAQVVGGLIEENPDIAPLTSKLMLTMAKEVKASGATFVFFVVPSKYRLSTRLPRLSTPEFSDKWNAWSQKHGVEGFVDIVPAFETCARVGNSPFFPIDIHFNRAGHTIVASQLCRRVGQGLGLSPECDAFQPLCG